MSYFLNKIHSFGATILNPLHLKKFSEAWNPDIWEARMGDVDKDSGLIEGATNWLGDVLGKDEWRTWEIEVEKIVKHPSYQNVIGMLALYDSAVRR